MSLKQAFADAMERVQKDTELSLVIKKAVKQNKKRKRKSDRSL